jgi:hypothetical protein
MECPVFRAEYNEMWVVERSRLKATTLIFMSLLTYSLKYDREAI